MGNGPQENSPQDNTPENARAPEAQVNVDANERLNAITRKLNEFNNAVRQKVREKQEAFGETEAAQKIAAIADDLDEVGETISKASKGAIEGFKKEYKLLPGTVEALPGAVKEQGKTLVQRIASIPGMNVVIQGAKTGWEAVADFMEKVGEAAYKFAEKLRPMFGRIMNQPLLRNFIGEKNIKIIEGLIGYDAESDQIAEEIKNRLPEGSTINISSTAEKMKFKDLYDQMLSKQNRTPTTYPRGVFVKEVIDIMIDEGTVKANTEITITQFATAAKKLIDRTPRAAVPAVPVSAPPAAPSPSAATPPPGPVA